MEPPRRSAFSLLELLIVIVIISILVSLLLPALSHAAAEARRARCLSNGQQAVEIFTLYFDDQRDSLPLMPFPHPPTGAGPLWNQYHYGGLAGLFSLQQVGDGVHTGFSPAAPGAYSDGSTVPLLRPYLHGYGILRCPADRSDRYYGFPYTPSGNMSYARAVPLVPTECGREQDVTSYNISYLYMPTLKAGPETTIWADETDGPDLNEYGWYHDPASPPFGPTPNSTAAGAAAAGDYAPGDNHGSMGANAARLDGSASFLNVQWAVRPVID